MTGIVGAGRTGCLKHFHQGNLRVKKAVPQNATGDAGFIHCFDHVSQDILITGLEQVSLKGIILNWFR